MDNSISLPSLSSVCGRWTEAVCECVHVCVLIVSSVSNTTLLYCTLLFLVQNQMIYVVFSAVSLASGANLV